MDSGWIFQYYTTNFEWQETPLSMKHKNSKALCECTESLMRTGSLFASVSILDGNVLALIRKELTKCSAVLMLHRMQFFPTQNGSVVSGFSFTIGFTLSCCHGRMLPGPIRFILFMDWKIHHMCLVDVGILFSNLANHS